MMRGWSVWVLMLALVMQGLPGGSLAAEMHGASTTVVINEVAWSGTTASSSDEWLELYNAGAAAVDLAGWTLRDGGDINLTLYGTLPAGGFFLLERTDDTTVNDIPADLIYTGSLGNSGETLTLRNASDQVVDTANGDGGAWPGGSAAPGYLSMERIDAWAPDSDGNWASNDGITRNGHAANGDPINGTPRQPNSASQPSPTPSPTPSFTPATPPTVTSTPTATPTPTPTPSASPTSPATATITASPTLSPTSTPEPGTPTATALTTVTVTPSATAAPSATPTGTPTPEPGTPTPTTAPSATPTTPPVSLNEALPAPYAIDWDGNGVPDQDDEYIELYNAGTVAVDLGGWQLDDRADGGTSPYTIPAGRLISPGGFVLFFRSETHVGLNNTGSDDVRLLAPSGLVVETFTYNNPRVDWSYSKETEGGATWTDAYPPSPGQPNLPATPTVTPSPGATVTLTITPTPGQVTVALNEALPAPESIDWNGDGVLNEDDEYIELYNLSDAPVDLGGWRLDDVAGGGSAPYTIAPGAILPAHGFRVFFRSQTHVALNNSGDDVRLLAPDGREADSFHYSTSHDDRAWSAVPDGSDYWTEDVAPSPGQRNALPAAPLTITGTVYRGQPGNLAHPLSGVTVQLWASARPNTWDRWLLNTWTDGRGDFSLTISQTLPGLLYYHLVEVDPVGLVSTGAVASLGGHVIDPNWIQFGPVTGGAFDGNRFWDDEPPPTPTPLPPGRVLITEVEYDTIEPNDDSRWEWLELHNTSDSLLTLDGWSLVDNLAADPLPTLVITPGGYLVVAARTVDFASHYPNVPAPVVQVADGKLGNGLGNTGDLLRLLDAAGRTVDALSWGNNRSVFDPAVHDVPPGHSIARWDPNLDSDTAADWADAFPPGPGRGDVLATPTPTPSPTTTQITVTPTATRTPVATATPTPAPQGTPGPLLISEVLYDGTITGTEGDEFVELFNPGAGPVDLGHYRIGDEETAGGSESMYHLPSGWLLQPGASVVVAKNAAAYRSRFAVWPDFEARVSGASYPDSSEVPNLVRDRSWGRGEWTLANTGDEVLLLDSQDRIVDALAYEGGDGSLLGLIGQARARAPLSLQRVGSADSDDLEADLRSAPPSLHWVEPWPHPVTPPSPWALPNGLLGLWGSLAVQSGYGDGEGPPAYTIALAQARGQHFIALADPLAALSDLRWQRTLTATMASDAIIALPGLQTEGIDLMGGASLPRNVDFWNWAPAQLGLVVSAPIDGWAQRSPLAQDLISLYRAEPHTLGEAQPSGVAAAQAFQAGQRVGLALAAPPAEANWRVGALVDSPDRPGLMDALRRGRTWITSDANLGLAVQSNAHWPGDLVPLQSELPLSVHYADDEPATLEVLQGTRIVAQFPTAGATVWSLTVRPTAGAAIWARALQFDGDVAASSPLFIEGPARPAGLRLNELMPAPRADWNHDGLNNTDDEWIEVYNRGPDAVDLYGWQLSDQPLGQAGDEGVPAVAAAVPEEDASADPAEAQAGGRWRMAASHWLEPGQFMVFFRSQTRLSLSDRGDQVHLLDPQGQIVDSFHWTRSPGSNRTWARTLDGGGIWVHDMAVTLGGPNLPATPTPVPTRRASRTPTPTPAPQDLGDDLARARTQPLNARIVVRGQVTTLAGTVAARVFYLQAGRVGLRIELTGTGVYPALALGAQVQVAGRLSTARGELKLRVSTPNDLQVIGPGSRLLAMPLRTGAVGEAWEGTLVSLRGVIVRLAGSSLWLDDGSGPVQVNVPSTAGFKRPRMQRGQLWAATGIVSQYGSRAPFLDGYRVLLRAAGDLNVAHAAQAARTPEGGGNSRSSPPTQPKSTTQVRTPSRPWRAPPHWLES